MPELSEDKRKQLDSIVGKMHTNNESDENIQTLVNDFKSKNSGPPQVQAPPSALSRFGTGLYNTTVGPLVQTAQHPLDTLSNIAGVPQLQEAWNQAKQGNYMPAAVSLHQAADPAGRMASGVPEPIAQDIQSGNYAGAAGQVTGLGASFAVPELAGKLGGARLGTAAGAGVRAASPDVAMGALKTGAGVGVGAAAHELGVPTSYAGVGSMYLSKPGLTQIGEGLSKGARAFGEAWKGPKVETPPGPQPPPIPKQTGITPQQLKSATVNGHMTPEQFDATIDARNDLTPEAKTFHKNDLRSAMQKASPPSLGQTEKPLSLGTMKASVKSGDNDINWFKNKLKQQGHSDEGIELESKRLEREIEESKEAEKAKEAKSTSKPKKPKVKPPSQAPQMKVEPPGVPQTPKVPQTPQTPQAPKVPQASPESMIEEATRGGPGTPPEMPVSPPVSNNQNLRNLMHPNSLETSGESPVQPQATNEPPKPSGGVNQTEHPIVSAVKKLQSGEGTYARPSDLKAAIPDITDKDILDLADQGKLVLSHYDSPVDDANPPEGTIRSDNRGKSDWDKKSPDYRDFDYFNGVATPRGEGAIGPVESPKVEASKSSLGEVEPPKTRRSPDRPYEDPDNPLQRGKITQAQIEEAQSTARAAKETRLARHLIENNIDLDNIPKTYEYRKSLGNDAGLRIEPSERTLEGAIRRARELKVEPPKP